MKYFYLFLTGCGFAAALIGYRYWVASRPEPRVQTRWGSAEVQEVKDALRVLTLAVESESLQWSYHKKEGRVFDDWRNVAVVVPVRTVLGFDPEKLKITSSGEAIRLELPPVEVISNFVLHAEKRQIIWKDEGNAFKDADWQSEVWKKGEAEALRKVREHGLDKMAASRAVALVKEFAIAGGVRADRLEVIVLPPS